MSITSVWIPNVANLGDYQLWNGDGSPLYDYCIYRYFYQFLEVAGVNQKRCTVLDSISLPFILRVQYA